MARADGTAKARWYARVAKDTGKSGPPLWRQVLKTLEFGLIMGGQPVTGGVVFEPPPPEPGLGEAPEQCAQQRMPILAEPDQRPRVQTPSTPGTYCSAPPDARSAPPPMPPPDQTARPDAATRSDCTS